MYKDIANKKVSIYPKPDIINNPNLNLVFPNE